MVSGSQLLSNGSEEEKERIANEVETIIKHDVLLHGVVPHTVSCWRRHDPEYTAREIVHNESAMWVCLSLIEML